MEMNKFRLFLAEGFSFPQVQAVKARHQHDEGGAAVIVYTGGGFRQSVIGNDGTDIDNAVGDDAGQQAAAAPEHQREGEADGNGVNQLKHGFQGAVAGKQIDDVPRAEGDGGNDDGPGEVLFLNSPVQQTAKMTSST